MKVGGFNESGCRGWRVTEPGETRRFEIQRRTGRGRMQMQMTLCPHKLFRGMEKNGKSISTSSEVMMMMMAGCR